MMYWNTFSKIFLMCTLLCGTPLHVWSSTTFQFDRSDISLRGSGCQPNTYAIAYTDDLQTMSILFDEFSASVPQYDGINENNDDVDGMGEAKTSKKAPYLQRKVCTIRLTALVPEGMFIDTMDVKLDFRGAVILDPGTTARFRSVLIGRSGLIKKNNKKKRQVIRKKWRAKKQAIEDDFVIQTKKSIPIASACAKKKDRRARIVFKNVISTKIRKKFRQQEMTSASIFIDSTDIVGKFSIKMHLASCQDRNIH